MSAYDNLRRANHALAQAGLYLAAHVGGRDTRNPERDGLLEPSTRLNVDSAIYQVQKALDNLREMRRCIETKDL